MKKFLAIALIATSFVACNEGEKKEETPAAETPAVETPAPVVETPAPATTDTTAAVAPVAADTTKK